MAEIRIETKPTFGNYGHLYLVFRDDDGIETVIRGGPATNNPLDFGNIVTQVDMPIEDSKDAREDETPEDRLSTVIDLSGRNADSVWEIMRQQAENINGANLEYRAFFESQNSNSIITSVLDSVGITIAIS